MTKHFRDNDTGIRPGTPLPLLPASGSLQPLAPTNAFVNDAAQTTDFYQILLADGSDNTVYTTIIDYNATGFDGAKHDFQLLVGENGHGNSVVTPYYFWVELS